MTKKPTTGNQIDTAPKRRQLAPRPNPYWVGLSGGRGGVSLGYRKPTKGTGAWIVKMVMDKKRIEERLANADDDGAPADALPYRDATARALEWAEQKEAAIAAVKSGEADVSASVRSVIETYLKIRESRSRRTNDATGRLTKHVLGDAKLADLPLSRLTVSSLQSWRGRLDSELAGSTINRLFNDFRAALNAGIETHGRSLPVQLPGIIRAGLKAVPDTETARKQILSDADVRRIVDAALAHDDDGDFGRLVLVLAATGARFSQVAGLTVADVQIQAGRLMIPPAAKGKSGKVKAHIPVPVGDDVLERLKPALNGRRGHEPLLMKWLKRQTGPFEWERVEQIAWHSASDMLRAWRATIIKAEMPKDTIPYALRHSSIVRGLRAGLPVRLVAGLHDTSIQMIERHYSAYILDMSDDLARRALVTLAPEQPAELRVVNCV